MRTVNVQRQGAVVALRQGTLRVVLHGELLASFPLELVEELLIYGGVTVTTPAMKALLEQQAAMHVLSSSGRHLGSLQPGMAGSTELIRAQVTAEQRGDQVMQAQAVVRAKLHHTALLVKRYQRRSPHPAWERTLTEHATAQAALASASSLNEIIGLEGHAAAGYFAAISETLEPEWTFTGRNRRPPLDPVNVLLSFGYTLLHQHVLTDLQRVGLHPGFGFLHQPHGRRPVLSLDLMEPHRALLVDRTVLTCVHRRLVTPAQFAWEGGAVVMNDTARETFLKQLGQQLDRPLQGTMTYRMFITQSVRRYAEAIRAGQMYQPQYLK
jgi:CRISPR-associated protein Cas1